VIERALGIEHGFWGCVAARATLRTLGRKRTPQDRAVIARHLGDLEAAEARVDEIYFARRSGEPADHDAMLDRWRAAPDGGDLVLEWPVAPPARRRSYARRAS
jgi:hypothetical protein